MQAKSSTVPAEPYPFELRPAECGLLIIDMQRDFLEPGGFGEMLGNDVSQLRRTIEPNRRLLAAWRAAGLAGRCIRARAIGPTSSDLPPSKKIRGRSKTSIGDAGPMGRILVRGEAGHDIIPELYPAPGEPVIDKPGKGAFYATDLHAILQHRGIKQLVVTGVTTEVCVNTTVREANDRGYDCLVLEDCVGSYFPEFQDMGLKMIKAQGGIFGWVSKLGRYRRGDRRRLSAAPQSAVSQEESDMAVTTADFKPKLWVPGDWNAFFGFGTNILVNVLVLTGLLRFVLKMPDALVFGRILPALGLMLFLSTVYYAWLAYRWRRRPAAPTSARCRPASACRTCSSSRSWSCCRSCSRPSDPVQAWEAGLTWVFVQSFVLMAGGFIAPDHPQDHAARGAARLARRHFDHLHLDAARRCRCSMTPVIGMVCFAIILVDWFGGVRYFKGVPGGLVAIVVGTVIAWGSTSFGFNYGGLSVEGLGDAFSQLRLLVSRCRRSATSSRGFQFIGVILVTAIPFGIYDLVEAMDNVESAAAAGDSFPTTRVLTADGVISLIGCLMGNPFINAVYIGHPGWKAMGGRIGYSAATGVMVIVLTWFGIIALMMALIPVVAILPILLYIGMLIGSQAFQETPHAPCAGDHAGDGAADRRLGQDCRSTARSAPPAPTPRPSASTSSARPACSTRAWRRSAAAPRSPASCSARSRCSSSSASSRRRRPSPLAGAIFTFFGLIHAEALGIGRTPSVAMSYLGIAVILLACSKYAGLAPLPGEASRMHGHGDPAAKPAE